MLSDEYELLIDELERKPNRYAARVLLYFIPVVFVCWLLNEIGIFLVDATLMRISSAIGLVVCIAPSILVRNDKWVVHPGCKYAILSFVIIDALLYAITLNFHTTLMLMLPMLVATQYRSRKVCWYALFGSVLCALLGPVVSFIYGMWDSLFFSTLLEMNDSAQILVGEPVDMPLYVKLFRIVIYLSAPKIMTILAFSVIIFAVNEHGISDVYSRMKIIHMNESDLLTDVLNRNMYETRVHTYENNFEKNLTCVFADADGLHELNNERGHAAGDELLKCVAVEVKSQFEQEDVYRVGGDEFVAFAVDLEPEEIERRVKQIRANIKLKGYHVSVGYAQCEKGTAIEKLISDAEQSMYEEKRKYYESAGLDRRRSRR